MTLRPFLFALILAPLLLPACDARPTTGQELSGATIDPAGAVREPATGGQIIVDPR